MENSSKKYAIITQVEFDTPGMSFLPDKSTFKTSIDKLLLDMKAAVEDIQPINLHSDLQQFINGLITDTAPRFSIIVDNSFKYRVLKRQIEEHLTNDFLKLEKGADEFEQCRKVHEFEQTWRFEDFEAKEEESKDLEFIKSLFETWSKWEQSIQKNIQQQINSGLIRADGKKLKDTLQIKVKKELHNLRHHLFKIASEVASEVTKKLDKIGEDLKRDMRNLETYVNFVRGLKQAEETIKYCEEKKSRLEAMKVVIQKNRDKEQQASSLPTSGNFVQILATKIEQI